MRAFALTLALAGCGLHTAELRNPEPEVGLPDGFRWDPAFGELAMGGEVSGTPVERSDVGDWVERRAGARAGLSGPGGIVGGIVGGALGGGFGRGLGAAPASEPAMAPSPVTAEGGEVAQVPPGGGLRAGKTDDNADFGPFLEFLATWTDRPGVAGNHVPMDVSDRRFVEVVDADGSPVPGARVSIVDRQADRVAWSGTTYGDGVAPFYPRLTEASSDWLVQVEHQGAWTTARWDAGSDAVRVVLDAAPPAGPVPLDVVFLIDTTGSMGDEIDRVKATLLSVTEQVRGLQTEVDLRYGAVLYRDVGDLYLTRHTPLTADVRAFDQVLQGIAADGGGDGPESLNQGLAVAVDEMAWREQAAKVVFLVADAPPHMDYAGDTPYADASRAALARGIRVHAVAASGLDDFGSLVFRQVAQLTRGRFVFVEYGSTAASAADHGVTGRVASNNLDAILFDELKAEVEGWGRPSGRVARR